MSAGSVERDRVVAALRAHLPADDPALGPGGEVVGWRREPITGAVLIDVVREGDDRSSIYAYDDRQLGAVVFITVDGHGREVTVVYRDHVEIRRHPTAPTTSSQWQRVERRGDPR